MEKNYKGISVKDFFFFSIWRPARGSKSSKLTPVAGTLVNKQTKREFVDKGGSTKSTAFGLLPVDSSNVAYRIRNVESQSGKKEGNLNRKTQKTILKRTTTGM